MKDTIKLTINGKTVIVTYEKYTNIQSLLKDVGVKRVKEIVNLSLKHDAINRAKDEFMKANAREQVIKNLARATGLSLKKAKIIVNSIVKKEEKNDS